MWHFLITDLAPPADPLAETGLPRLPSLEALLASGRVVARTPTWRHHLLALAGQPWPAASEVPVAAHLAAAAGLVGGGTPAFGIGVAADSVSPENAPAAAWAVAAPVRCVAGLDHVQLQALGAPLAPEVVAGFNAALGGPSGQLHATPQATLWSFPAPLAVSTHDPAALVGHDVGPCLPTGPDAAVLRRWMTEAQMWLHGAGEPAAVNGLWPWGLGTAEQAANPPTLPWSVEGADAWARSLPRSAVAAPARDAGPGAWPAATRVALWQLAEHAGPAGAFAAADEAWSGAIAAALRDNDRVGVWLAGRCHELRATDRWRFWRRWHTPRPWWQ
jgi:hypothetical protein